MVYKSDIMSSIYFLALICKRGRLLLALTKRDASPNYRTAGLSDYGERGIYYFE